MSIDAQRRQLVELAQARGLPIVAEFADAVESGLAMVICPSGSVALLLISNPSNTAPSGTG